MKYKNLTYMMTHPLILLWFMILGGVMMFLLGWQSRTRYLEVVMKQPTSPTIQRTIGQQITTDGTIEGIYGFGMLYFKSHGEVFVIKSTSVNLNQLTGSVKVSGVISEFNGTMPVINVYDYKSETLPDVPQFRYDATNRIVFRPGYDVVITSSGDLLTITDPIVNQEVVKIRTFSCIEGNMSEECNVEYSNAPSFVSSYHHKFFQKGDLRYVFGDGIGYRIWTRDEYYINIMSQYFDLVNERLMADLIKKNLKTKCVGPQTSVVEYLSHTIREQNDNTFVIVRGLNPTQKMSVCQLKLLTDNHTIGFESITTIPIEE